MNKRREKINYEGVVIHRKEEKKNKIKSQDIVQ